MQSCELAINSKKTASYIPYRYMNQKDRSKVFRVSINYMVLSRKPVLRRQCPCTITLSRSGPDRAVFSPLIMLLVLSCLTQQEQRK